MRDYSINTVNDAQVILEVRRKEILSKLYETLEQNGLAAAAEQQELLTNEYDMLTMAIENIIRSRNPQHNQIKILSAASKNIADTIETNLTPNELTAEQLGVPTYMI